MENFLKSPAEFYNHLGTLIKKDSERKNTLYILPIKYAGFVSPEQQEIGKRPIPGYPNVINLPP